MKTRSTLAVLGIVTFLSALGAGRQAQAEFTLVFNEWQAQAVYAQNAWISGTVLNPYTGAVEWTYYYPLLYINGYAGDDGQWYYVMTFDSTEQLAYTNVYGVTSHAGQSGTVWDPYAGGSTGGGGGGGSTGGGHGGGVITDPAQGGSSGGVLGIDLPGSGTVYQGF